MITQMQAQGLIPGAWDVANFGALRGVDSFRSVSTAIVVSRQLPPPAEVERMASIIFASDVQTVLDWYPIRSGARLMSNGTGRAAEFECHPDERVEAIRFDHGGRRHSVYVSALCFWEDPPGSGPKAEGGPWAIEQFLEGRHIQRFIQSFKSFAASASSTETVTESLAA